MRTVNKNLTDRLYDALSKQRYHMLSPEELAYDVLHNVTATARDCRLAQLLNRSCRNDDRRDWKEYIVAREQMTDEEREAEEIRNEQDNVYWNGIRVA